jgi:predicted glycosyltransferase
VRIVVYSHDTFGIGNIRRMLAICKHLNDSIPEVSILIVTGSPMLQSFRIPDGIDYVKLPCLKRDQDGNLAVRSLRHLQVKDLVEARRDLLFSVIRSFRPDMLLVDKKPAGLAGELMTSIVELKLARPNAKVVLVLRDILDSPLQMDAVWRQQWHYEVLEAYYDRVLVLGTRDLFDVCEEYQFPGPCVTRWSSAATSVASPAPPRAPRCGVSGESTYRKRWCWSPPAAAKTVII